MLERLEKELQGHRKDKQRLQKEQADLEKLVNKRREMTIDHRFDTANNMCRKILNRFRDREITFQILVASGNKNIGYLESVMKQISDYTLVDKLKSGKDRNGYSYMRLRITRAAGFLQKFDQKIEQATKRRLLREAWKRRHAKQQQNEEDESFYTEREVESELKVESESSLSLSYDNEPPMRGLWRRRPTLR